MALQFWQQYSKKSAWYPTNLPGCVLWLDAGQGITKDSGDYVSVWADQSGKGNNAAQPTGANQPLWENNVINGKPAIKFDSLKSLIGTTISGLNSSSFDLFIITKGLKQTGQYNGMFFGINNYNNGLWVSRYTAGQWANLYINSVRVETPNSSLPNAGFDWMTLEVEHNIGIQSKIYFDQVQKATKLMNGFTNGNYYIGNGGYAGQTYLQAYIAEIILCENTLDTTNKTLLYIYINTKYGI